jgi:hypothetical protein
VDGSKALRHVADATIPETIETIPSPAIPLAKHFSPITVPVQNKHLNPRRTPMNIKSFALAAAMLALPAAIATPVYANGASGTALSGGLVEVSALDAANFAISLGGRRGGSVLVGRPKESSQRRVIVRGGRARAF